MKVNELVEGVEYCLIYKNGKKSSCKYRVLSIELQTYSESDEKWVRSKFEYNDLIKASFEPCEWVPKHGEGVYCIDPFSYTGYNYTEYAECAFYKRSFERGYIVKTQEDAIARVKELGWDK